MEKEKKKSGCAKIVLAVIGIVVLLGVIGSLLGGGSYDGGSKGSTPNQQTKQITYTPATVNDMISALNANALGASDTYKNQYLEVTGRLAVIDSSGQYISLLPDDPFAFTGVQCYLKNDAQRDIVKTLAMDSQVTVRGKCKDVGEILGYTLNIDEIVQS